MIIVLTQDTLLMTLNYMKILFSRILTWKSFNCELWKLSYVVALARLFTFITRQCKFGILVGATWAFLRVAPSLNWLKFIRAKSCITNISGGAFCWNIGKLDVYQTACCIRTTILWYFSKDLLLPRFILLILACLDLLHKLVCSWERGLLLFTFSFLNAAI